MIPARTLPSTFLRAGTAAALATVAVVHLALASRYDPVGEAVTLGQLFRLQAVLALAAALAVLLRPGRQTTAAAVLLGLGSLLAVVGTTYQPLPALGPLPRVYEPIWFREKAIAAAAAALTVLLGGAALLGGRSTPPPRGTLRT